MNKVQRNNNRIKVFGKTIKKHKFKLMLFVLPIIIAIAVLCLKYKSDDKVYAIDDSVFINSLSTETASNNNGEDVTWYIIDDELELIELMDYTSRHDCNGMYFKISEDMTTHIAKFDPDTPDDEGSETGISYHVSFVGLKTYMDSNDEIIYKNKAINGFSSNVKLPFRGTINFNGLIIRTDTPVFCFLGSGANITNLSVWGDITDEKMKTIVTKNVTLGALAGTAILDGSADINISQIGINNGITISSSSKSVGGLIGTVIANPNNLTGSKGYNNITGESDYNIEADYTQFNLNINQISINNSVEYNRTTHFYSLGYRGTDYSTPISDATKGTLKDSSPAATGGLIGIAYSTSNSYYLNINIMGNNKIEGEFENDKYATGGLIGFTGYKVKTSLSGKYDLAGITKVSSYHTYNSKGYLIGAMGTGSLSYMNPGTVVTKPVDQDLEKLSEVEVAADSNLAGTFFKNTSDSYVAMSTTNEYVMEGTGTKDDPYIIDGVEDFERLAIFMSTEGHFGFWKDIITKQYVSWFYIPDIAKRNRADSREYALNYIRSAYFKITDDIDLPEKGIIRINRSSIAAFQGSLIGEEKASGGYPTISQYVDTNQDNVYLIPYAYTNIVYVFTKKGSSWSASYTTGVNANEFKNFNITGTVKGRANVGGFINTINLSNKSYSSIEVDNVHMVDLYITSKINNSATKTSGFIEAIYGSGVNGWSSNTNIFTKSVNFSFNNVSFSGGLYTYGNNDSKGAAIVDYIYCTQNNFQYDTENKYRTNISFTNIDISGEIKQKTASRGCYLNGVVGYIQDNTNLSVSTGAAGMSNVKTFPYNNLVMNNINIHDIQYSVGTGYSSGNNQGALLANEIAFMRGNIENVNLTNVSYDVQGNHTLGMLIKDNKLSILNMSNINYDKVTFIKTNSSDSGVSTFIFNNSGVVYLKDYTVTNSVIMTGNKINRMYELYYGPADNDYKITFANVSTYSGKCIFSLENSATRSYDINNNGYESSYTYCQYSESNLDEDRLASSVSNNASFKETAYKSNALYYNIKSNMTSGIQGTGTKDDPFIIDSEAKMVALSAVFSLHPTVLAEVSKDYFSDLDEVIDTTKYAYLQNADRMSAIYNGYYVITADINLDNYTYYPLKNFTGRLYGFNVEDYLGSTPSDAQKKQYASAAIKALEGDSSSLSKSVVNDHKPKIELHADNIAGGIISNNIPGNAINMINSSGATTTKSSITDNWKSPCTYSHPGIYYECQNSIFGHICGSSTYVKIGNLEISGVAASNNNNSTNGGGSIFISGCDMPAVYQASVDISDIDFSDDVLVVQRIETNGSENNAIGLLIDYINNGKINLDGIRILEGTNIRADALIAYQTGDASSVKFKNIDLNAAIDQGQVQKATNAAKPTGYADTGTLVTSEKATQWRKPGTTEYSQYGFGFRYAYYYYNLAAGVAIYTFDDGDIVTPGRIPLMNNEKPYQSTYVDSVSGDTVTNEYVGTDATLQNEMLLAYIQKYAYKTYAVSVNPQSANITKGSGTKDDPYIIENVGQLATLETFIKSTSGSIVATDWYVGEATKNHYKTTDEYGAVVETGYDEDDSNSWKEQSNLLYTTSTGTSYYDSVKKKLCRAYYRITKDLDFTDHSSKFASLAESYAGLGTSSFQFAGVIEGGQITEVVQGQTVSRNPVIKLGNSSNNTYAISYGLINYGRGFMVKNVDIQNGYLSTEMDDFDAQIEYAQDESNVDYIMYKRDNCVAGLVAARITGGDNVIQNVKVAASIKFESSPSDNTNFGGYVGFMQYGTLTVSGITEDTFKDLKISYASSSRTVSYNPSSNYAKYISAVVGKLNTGGYVVYREDPALIGINHIASDVLEINTSRVVTKKTISGKSYSTCGIDSINYFNLYGVPCSSTTNLINQKYLDNIEPIKVIYDERTGSASDSTTYVSPEKQGKFICKLDNADQLYLYSIAVGSGSMTAGSGVYPSTASSQKIEADYTSWIANENANISDSSISFNTDTTFPAVFKYFDFTALDKSYKSVIVNNACVFNYNSQKSNTNNRTTFMLSNPNSNYVYDMSVYGDAFSGIGRKNPTSFDNTQTYYASFAANFDGNGHTINLDLKRTSVVGLFLELYTDNTVDGTMLIENVTISGEVEQTSDSSGWAMVGGVVGLYRGGYYKFKNITLTDLTIRNRYNSKAADTDGMVGGIIGFCKENNTNYYNRYTTFEDIVIGAPKGDGTYGQVYLTNYNGDTNRATSSVGGIVGTASTVNASNITVNNLTIESAGNVGAVAGYIICKDNNNTFCSLVEKCTVNNSNFICHSATKGVGSIVGYLQSQYKDNNVVAFYDVTSTNNSFTTLSGNTRMAALVGYHTGAGRKEFLKVKIKDNVLTGATSTEVDKPWNCEQANDTTCVCIYYNDFDNLDAAEEEYGIRRYNDNDVALVKYADFLEENFFTTTDAGTEVPVDLIPETSQMDNRILRWSTESGVDVLTMLNSVLDSLTNESGEINSTGLNVNNAKILNVSVQGMKISDGVASTNSSSVINCSYRDTTKQYSITTTNSYDSFEKKDDEGNTIVPATYSLVTIQYSVGYNYERTETITIPLFVSNMINVDIYSKVYIGEEYDIDAMRAIQLTASDTQIATADSSYTVYTEYMYGSNRFEYDEELYMYKGFEFYNASNSWIAKGTRLTLIDLTFEDDVKTYYYTLDDAMTFVPLMDFVDEKGNHYQERNLNDLDELPSKTYYDTMYVNGRITRKYNRGVERYLLFVDCSNTQQDSSIDVNTVYSPLIVNNVAATDTEHTIKDVFYVKKRTYNTLSTSSGRTIKWDESSASAIGEISKDKQLEVSASFDDTASDYYWNNLMDYDFNNTNKYLEVAIYLVNDNGDKVMLPSGTRIKYPGYSDVAYDAVQNSSSIFYYKDSPDNQYYSLMVNRKDDGTTSVDFTLDFTYAKMENMESGSYKLCMEIVRTANRSFPMGDDIVDSITIDSISLIATVEYGFKLSEKSDIAINKKDILDGQDIEVEYNTIINSNLTQTAIDKKLENDAFKLTYSILIKNELGDFVPYTGSSNIMLTIDENGNEVTTNLTSGTYEHTLSDMVSEGEDAYELKCKLTYPYSTEISNYKIVAKFSVDGEDKASDFIIMNIANVDH